MKEDKKQRGRPKKYLADHPELIKQIESLAKIMCTDDEIAQVIGWDEDTLKAEHNKIIFSECKKKGQAAGKMSLRRSQLKYAKKGNPALLIWLGRNWLDQTDKTTIEHTGSMNINNPLTDMTTDELREALKKLN